MDCFRNRALVARFFCGDKPPGSGWGSLKLRRLVILILGRNGRGYFDEHWYI